jgi:hypothetical protein
VVKVNLNEWFEKGLTVDGYIQQMTRNKEEMLSIYEKYSVSEADKSKLEKVKPLKLRAIALSEDWCGDAMLNNPVLLRLAEAADIEVRFLLRDQNLELMDQYLTNGTSRAIPIYIFIGQDGQEAGKWGPRAPEMQERVTKGRAALPDKEAPDFEEKQRDLYKQLNTSYLEDASVWQIVADSIIGVLVK